MATLIIIIFVLAIKYWMVILPLSLLVLFLLCRDSDAPEKPAGKTARAGYYRNESYDEPYDEEYEYEEYSSERSGCDRADDYDDYYDFGPEVSSDKMYEHAAHLAEEDQEVYAELEMVDC